MATHARALLTITFMNGNVRECLISAHKGIAARLAEEAGERGVLAAWNNEQSFGFPIENIEGWEITDLSEEEIEAESLDEEVAA